MASSLQTLVKILRLEQQKDYQNKAVIGGLGRFAYHWAKEAHSQAQSDAEHTVVDTISGMLRDYDDRPLDDRPAAIEEIIALAQSQPSISREAPRPQPQPARQEPSRAEEPEPIQEDDLFSEPAPQSQQAVYTRPSDGEPVVAVP